MHGVTLHAFADDTQMYLHYHPDYMTSAVALLDRCIALPMDACQPLKTQH